MSGGTRRAAPGSAHSTPAYMSGVHLADFRDALAALKAKILRDLGRLVSAMREEPEVAADPNDRASLESDLILQTSNRERGERILHEIDRALQRIDDREYGYCASCGEEIGLTRLKAQPTATLCIDCQARQEFKQRQGALNGR